MIKIISIVRIIKIRLKGKKESAKIKENLRKLFKTIFPMKNNNKYIPKNYEDRRSATKVQIQYKIIKHGFGLCQNEKEKFYLQ